MAAWRWRLAAFGAAFLAPSCGTDCLGKRNASDSGLDRLHPLGPLTAVKLRSPTAEEHTAMIAATMRNKAHEVQTM